jgi:uncharacterized membrane protein YheB (UPF0754 family)
MVQKQNLQILSVLSETLKAYTQSKEDFSPEDVWQMDIIQPNLGEVGFFLQTYANCKQMIDLIHQQPELKTMIYNFLGEDALAIFDSFEERISIILPELVKILRGEATEEDYEELVWQNKIAKTKKQLKKMAQMAKTETITLTC